MPIELSVLRHGRSEGNAANARSRAGDHSAFTAAFKDRHSSLWRLTDRGRAEATTAGKWLRSHGMTFDRHLVSTYVRAMETAVRLELPDAQWRPEYYLRERDWGQLDVMSVEERMARFAEEMARRERDGFYWAPPGGESMAQFSLRIDRVLDTLHRECSNQRVLIVCHGEVMWALRIRLERMSQRRFMELDQSKDPKDHIHNCQVIQYSRRDPTTGVVCARYEWMRSVCPWDLTRSRNEWERIVRPTFSNDDLAAEVEAVPRLIAE
ncbi:histidine phosphatase family protein [Candidatus Uhrbacteria bacterium]|nr:histidine phosphatase family protein [Candidatus Uhrbacteria bacterium]